MSQLTRTSIAIIPPGLAVQTLTGNTGGAVGPDGSNNINVIGDGTTITSSGDGATHTLTFTVEQIFASTYTTDDANFAVPSAYNLNVFGADGITTTSSGDTVTIHAGGTIATTYDADSGSATPSANVLNIVGGTGISTSGSGNTITITGSPLSTFTYTPVSSSPYVVLSTDQYLGVNCSAGAITIELPNAPSTGRYYVIKDSTGSAATHNITVTTVGGTVDIDGATSFVMNTAYEAVNVIFNGTSWEIF